MLLTLSRLRHMLPSRLGLIAAIILCLGVTGQSQALNLTIAAGAGYKRPISELVKAFERSSGIKVEPIYGNMGQILSQAVQTDQITLIFGDQNFLENAKQVNFAQYLPAGKGRLVLAWPQKKHLTSPEDLLKPEFSRIALPDVRHAVYGKASGEFLARSGLAGRLTTPLLTVATVPQVSAYLISGEVDAGFINLTEALGIAERIGGYLEIDPQYYSRINIVGAVIEGRENRPGVHELASFLNTEEARSILAKHGL